MSNIYDVFRGVQAQKTSCYDERSAAFITEGVLSTDITHIRLNKNIKAAITFNDKEGPDDAIVYTNKITPSTDELSKGDYFIYDNGYYLVYENIKLTDKNLNWKKQRAVECNVSFIIGTTTHRAYFLSTLRAEEDPLLKKNIVVSQEAPLVIVASTSSFNVGTPIMIEEKPFKIKEFDAITNRGITYLYLERNYITTTTIPTPAPTPALNTLNNMTEYTFTTKDGYFAATPKITILDKRLTSVKFIIPYGINSVVISIKNNEDVVIETTYSVVL